ncbi:MAG: phosphate ABC transporter permease PstA, partial [Pseudomonadota bacterium]
MVDQTARKKNPRSNGDRLRRRRLSERFFRSATICAVGLIMSMLALIIYSVTTLSIRAFTHNQIVVSLTPRLDSIPLTDRGDVADSANTLSALNKLVADEIDRELARDKITATDEAGFARARLFAPVAVSHIAEAIAKNPGRLGQTRSYRVPISSNLDLYLKGQLADQNVWRIAGKEIADHSTTLASDSASEFNVSITQGVPEPVLRALSQSDEIRPSVFLETQSAVFKVDAYRDDHFSLRIVAGELSDLKGGVWLRVVWTPAAQRAISDQQIAEVNLLKRKGIIRAAFHPRLWTSADSTFPELAGVLSALAGSLLVLLVTAFVAVPIGVMAAIWLEEFAPRSRLTEFIEISINNLAAVPPIVFGLLGAAVLLNLFGLPRSAPVAGGLVLAFLTLPTVIIASRAALSAVPNDIRIAAFSLGASRMQVAMDHVLPAAAPGVITGVILGLARSLGEVAPLLLIGMVIFVGAVPDGINDEATTLPVLIYKWSTGAERAWEPLTAAAIVILLLIMVLI